MITLLDKVIQFFGMSEIYHSTKQLATRLYFGFVNFWTPVKCSEDNNINDSYFVAALVFFIATVERSVNTTYSLSQFNPVTASNSYQSDMTIITDSFPKTVNDITPGVTPINTTTVAFLTKNHFQNIYAKRPMDSGVYPGA